MKPRRGRRAALGCPLCRTRWPGSGSTRLAHLVYKAFSCVREVGMLEGFARDPAWFFEDERWDQAIVALSDYFARYEGSWFDLLADHDHPYRITARDIVAVSMLQVQIPIRTAIWLLGDGAAEVTALLERIPLDWVIWQRDADLTRDGAAWRLWNAIDSNWWPLGSADPGMGPTKISKLLAAKRPNLVPIQDSLVRRGIFGDEEPADYWKHW